MRNFLLSVGGGLVLTAAIATDAAESVDAKLLGMLKANGSITAEQYTELSSDLAKDAVETVAHDGVDAHLVAENVQVPGAMAPSAGANPGGAAAPSPTAASTAQGTSIGLSTGSSGGKLRKRKGAGLAADPKLPVRGDRLQWPTRIAYVASGGDLPAQRRQLRPVPGGAVSPRCARHSDGGSCSTIASSRIFSTSGSFCSTFAWP